MEGEGGRLLGWLNGPKSHTWLALHGQPRHKSNLTHDMPACVKKRRSTGCKQSHFNGSDKETRFLIKRGEPRNSQNAMDAVFLIESKV